MTKELLDCALIGVGAVIRSNTEHSFFSTKNEHTQHINQLVQTGLVYLRKILQNAEELVA